MAQKQLNLSPEAVTVLLEALSVLNLGSASDASTSSSAPAVSSNDANDSAGSAVPAGNAAAPPATQLGVARARPIGVLCLPPIDEPPGSVRSEFVDFTH
ncbi:hypothetical protein EV421DRAFT_1912115 [Armillaria borealis]|uniref:Uncharacterized protein n=1 Tax=Armillaria borealis TaxID=47425 RepID=A0AA39MDT5_9AGAR|nr:hypothetical protein EV421DRAFT_1912115 [Armillaria borealis]